MDLSLQPLKIKDPIIIHGPGRSGTTLLSNILSLYSKFFWISGYNNKFPFLPSIALLNNLLRFYPIEKYTRGIQNIPRPAEGYGFWTYFIHNFNKSDIENNNIEKQGVEECIKTINKIKNVMIGNRFITKITGNSRVTILNTLFSNPYIIWIDRDPRIVVLSYMQNMWYFKNNLEEYIKMSRFELIKFYCDKYLDFYKDKKKLMNYNFIQVKFEELLVNREKVFFDIFNFISEEINPQFQQTLKSWDIKQNQNEKYNGYINEIEMEFLTDYLKIPIDEMGY
jgi:hypothetical protein